MYLGFTDLFPSTNPVHGHNTDVLGNWPKRAGDRPWIRNVSFLAFTVTDAEGPAS